MISPMTRAERRRRFKAVERHRHPGDGFAQDVANSNRAYKRRACRMFGISGKRYRALERRNRLAIRLAGVTSNG